MEKEKKVSLADFGLPRNTTIAVPDYTGTELEAFVPRIDPGYQPGMLETRLAINWLLVGAKRGRALYLWGPSGTGKSSFARYLAGKMGLPLFEDSLSSGTMIEDLKGTWTPAEGGGFVFHEGPLIQAVRNGGIVLLNEADRAPQGLLVSLHSLLDGECIQTPLGSVRPNQWFRLILTGNTSGQGDLTGQYSTAETMDIAFLNRCDVLKFRGLTPEEEAKIIASKIPPVAPVATLLADLAQEIRAALRRVEAGVVFNTRSVLTWAEYTYFMRNFGPNGEMDITKSVFLGLVPTLLNYLDDAATAAVIEVIEAKTGQKCPDLSNGGY